MSFFVTRRFLPLFITQFLGAFNDNLLKNALVMLITYRLADRTENPELLITLAAGLFMLPYFLFSATAGEVADTYDRARITRLVKLFEIGIVSIASVGFYFEHVALLMTTLFCMGVHSTFFGPVKYALLPQHLREDELLSGNGYIESGTFLAILLGAITGGLLILQPMGVTLVALLLLAVALSGYASSRYIPEAPPPDPSLRLSRNLAKATYHVIRHGSSDRVIWFCILAISWFWFVGSVFVAQFPNYAKLTLGGDETVVTLMLAIFSVGIAFGSAMCGKLLRGRITLRYVSVAGIGITLAIADLYVASGWVTRGEGELVGAFAFLLERGGWRIALDLFILAVSGGIYIVPLYAMLQHASDPLHRARNIAANNIMNALFMVASSATAMLLLEMGVFLAEIFLIVGIFNLVFAILHRKHAKP